MTKPLIQVSREAYEAQIDGKLIQFSPKEHGTLLALMDAKGKTLSRENLLESVWGITVTFETEKDVRTVDQHIARIRRKLGRHQERVAAVYRRGYRWR